MNQEDQDQQITEQLDVNQMSSLALPDHTKDESKEQEDTSNSTKEMEPKVEEEKPKVEEEKENGQIEEKPLVKADDTAIIQVATEADLASRDLKIFKQRQDKPSKIIKYMVNIPECLDAEQKKIYEEDIDYFTCKCCGYIVRDSILCRKCTRVFCSDCTNVKENNRTVKMCPTCKDDSPAGKNRLAKLDGFALRHLQNLKFNCQHHECCGRKNMFYEDAISHLTQCVYEYYHCPFNCVQKGGQNKEIAQTGVQGLNLFKHLDVCEFNQKKCEKCGLMVVVKDMDKHDCMRELKKLIYQKEVNVIMRKEEFGIDYDRLNLRCDNNHPLKMVRGKPLSHAGYSSGAQCNKCRQGQLENMEYFYHCKLCNFDLCKGCALQKGKVLGNKIKSQLHKCELQFIGPSRGYRCDCGYERGANNDLTDVKCESGHTNFYQGTWTQRWQCRACDFDMCIKCAQKFAFVPIQDITQKDCALAYFIVQSSIFSGDLEVHINRFLLEEKAKDYFIKIQKKSINNTNVSEESKFGILIHKGKILARYGSLQRITKLISDIKTEQSHARFKKLFGKKLDEVKTGIEQRQESEILADPICDYISPQNFYYYGQNRMNGQKVSVVTRLHIESSKDATYNVTPQCDAHAKFWNGELISLKYKSNDENGKRAIFTDEILEGARQDGAYTPPESSKNQKNIVYWLVKKKVEGGGENGQIKDEVYWTSFRGNNYSLTFLLGLTSPTNISKIRIKDGELDTDNILGDDDDVQKLMDRATEDGNIEE